MEDVISLSLFFSQRGIQGGRETEEEMTARDVEGNAR